MNVLCVFYVKCYTDYQTVGFIAYNQIEFLRLSRILYKNMQCVGSILWWTRLYVIILSHRVRRRIVMFSGISCQMDQFPYKPTHLVHFCCIHCFVRFIWPCNFKCKCTCTNIVCLVQLSLVVELETLKS